MRFFNADPLSDEYAYQSYYNFSENSVVNSRELEGLEMVIVLRRWTAAAGVAVRPSFSLRDGAYTKLKGYTKTPCACEYRLLIPSALIKFCLNLKIIKAVNVKKFSIAKIRYENT